jgi:hypothetical protein
MIYVFTLLYIIGYVIGLFIAWYFDRDLLLYKHERKIGKSRIYV